MTQVNPTALQRFDQLINDYNTAQHTMMLNERLGHDYKMAYENTVEAVERDIAEFVIIHAEAIRQCLHKGRDGKEGRS